jgi:hypothetical protein
MKWHMRISTSTTALTANMPALLRCCLIYSGSTTTKTAVSELVRGLNIQFENLCQVWSHQHSDEGSNAHAVYNQAPMRCCHSSCAHPARLMMGNCGTTGPAKMMAQQPCSPLPYPPMLPCLHS